MTHPKNIEVGSTYSPESWKISNKQYYSIVRNAYGYWATYYVKAQEHDRSFYPCVVNDKIAKSFTSLCKKVDAVIERKKTRELA